MVDQERRHAEPGRIADPDAASQLRFDRHGALAAAGSGDMLAQVDRKRANQPDRQQFRLERPAKLGSACYRQAIRRTELAGTVNRGGAHQIADRLELLAIGLLAGGETFDHLPPQAHRLVGA